VGGSFDGANWAPGAGASSHRPRAARFVFGYRVPAQTMPDTTKGTTTRSLVEACAHHRGVAGITEGTEAVVPIRILFGRSVMRDGRFNWSSYRTVVMHVTEVGRGVHVIVLPLIIISWLITGMIIKIKIKISATGRHNNRQS
jgi:hypothetical protein